MHFVSVFEKNFTAEIMEKDKSIFTVHLKRFLNILETFLNSTQSIPPKFKLEWDFKIKSFLEDDYAAKENKENKEKEKEDNEDNIEEQIKDIDSFFEENFDGEGKRTNINEICKKKIIDDDVSFEELRRFSILSTSQISSFYTDEKEVEGENFCYVEGTKRLKFLSINLFLKKIIFEDFYDKNEFLVDSFFTQFTAFLKPEVLINKMISCFTYYVSDSSKLPKTKLNNLIDFSNRIILELYESRDFIDIEQFKKELKSFYDLLRKHPEFNNNDYSLIETLLTDENSSVYDVEYVRNSIMKRSKARLVVLKKKPVKEEVPEEPPDAFFILKHNPADIAETLTQISKLEFALIKTREVIGARFCKESKRQITSPTIVKITERGNKLIFFVIEEILAYDHKQVRANVIEQWICVIDELVTIHNYHDSIFILTALNNYIVQKLQKTWKLVKKESLTKLEYYNKLFSIGDNYRMLREEIEKHKETPYLPYLGLLQKDIIHTEEIKKYVKDNTLINFEKIFIIQNILNNFFLFNNYAYNFNPNPKYAFFHCLITKTEDELEELVNKIEPVFTIYDKKREQKRFTKVDETFFPCLGDKPKKKIVSNTPVKKLETENKKREEILPTIKETETFKTDDVEVVKAKGKERERAKSVSMFEFLKDLKKAKDQSEGKDQNEGKDIKTEEHRKSVKLKKLEAEEITDQRIKDRKPNKSMRVFFADEKRLQMQKEILNIKNNNK